MPQSVATTLLRLQGSVDSWLLVSLLEDGTPVDLWSSYSVSDTENLGDLEESPVHHGRGLSPVRRNHHPRSPRKDEEDRDGCTVC